MLLKKEKICLGHNWKRLFFNYIPYSCEGCRISISYCLEIPVLMGRNRIASLKNCCLYNEKIIYVMKDIYYATKERIDIQ